MNDYDFDDPHHQADLDGIIERLLARRRADRSRLTDPLSRMMDIISDPFKRTEESSEKPIKQVKQVKQVTKPLHRELPAARTVDEMRANLGKSRGTRRGRKAKPLSDQPTLDLELIESMFNDGATLAQIRATLHVGLSKLRLELFAFLPHIAEEASKRRGRKPRAIDSEQVRRMREGGMSLYRISRQLGVDRARVAEMISVEPSLKLRIGSVNPADVLRLRAEGKTQAQIASELGCSEQTIYKYLRRIREREKSEIEQVTKPLPEELPAASTVEELRARLGKRKGTRSGRKEQPFSGKPTLDLELIERLFNEGATIHQIRAALHVGSARFRFEILTFLPHIAEAATKRRGRKSRLPPAVEEEQVKRLRDQGWGWKRIAAELIACHKRLMRQYGQPSTDSTTSTTTPTALK